jgi:hypothetical protein
MKTVKTRLPVPNCVVFIQDPVTNDFPDLKKGSLVWSTSSCVAVSCLPDVDGATEIVMGALDNVEADLQLVFEGQLTTPNREVAVQIVPNKSVLKLEVPTPEIHVRIWTDGFPDTNKVVIGVSA